MYEYIEYKNRQACIKNERLLSPIYIDTRDDDFVFIVRCDK